MFDVAHTGTRDKIVQILSKKLLDKIAIPLAKREYELNPNNKQPLREWIRSAVSDSFTREYIESKELRCKDLQREIDKKTDEIIADIIEQN